MNSTFFKTNHFPVNDKTKSEEQILHSSEKLCSLQNLDRPALSSASEQNKSCFGKFHQEKNIFPPKHTNKYLY